ncbi:MAG: Gfo/Idh/MocA family protein [Candidatus Cyclobacteriaceae bacterium M3_2C_046]
MHYSRRKFIENSGKVLAGAGLTSALGVSSLTAGAQKIAANDKIVVGLVGCKGMGFSNLRNFIKFPEVEVKAFCDVDQGILDQRAQDLQDMNGTKVDKYTDYRKLLEDKDIDAVIVGTPDHWHCLVTVDAIEAGKDVYCEKPLANTIEECDIMINAARKHNKIVQVGQWQRSGPHWKDAIDYVRSGKLGNIRLTKAWAYQGWMKNIPQKPDQPAPAGVDYDMWLGPASQRPFNPNRFHFNFRWFWDYAGGLMTDWGVHLIDMVLYGMDAKAPKSVLSSGGMFAYPGSAMETPDTQQAIYEFDNFSMIWEHAVGIDGGPYGRNHGVAFIGNNGTLVVDRGGWEIIPEEEENQYLVSPIPRQSGGGGDLEKHVKDFLNSVKTRQLPACDVAIAANTAKVAHLGNIAFKTGRKVYWDHENSQFKNDEEANALVKAEYRSPWKVPKY